MNEKRKLLVLNYEFPPLGGGASPVSYDLVLQLSETGNFDIDVVTMKYKDLPALEVVNDNFRIHRVRAWRSRKEICYPWEQLTYLVSAWFTCKELVSKNNYFLSHAHFLIPTGILALLLNKRFGIPYIVTSHGSDIPGFNPDRFTWLHKITGPFLRVITKNANKIITPSQYLKDLIVKNIALKIENKIEVIPNGINAWQFKSLQKKNIIFASGRLLRRKGFQYLIRAVSSEDIGWEVHIAGDGPMMSELKVLAAASKTKIIFHGWLDNTKQEYRDLMEQASIYVLASSHESFGMVLIEAMSAGCAVIATDIPACRETVGDAGILVPFADSNALKQQIGLLIRDGERVYDLEMKGMNRVRDCFSWEVITKEYVKSFE